MTPCEALMKAIAESAEPMRWGVDDCGLFAANIVQAVTGHDPAAEVRGQYQNQLTAARLYRKNGGTGAVLVRAGWKRVQAPTDLDIGLIEARPMKAAAVFVAGMFHVRGPVGVTSVPPSAISEIYRCPR
jgi:hypothetical protein